MESSMSLDQALQAELDPRDAKITELQKAVESLGGNYTSLAKEVAKNTTRLDRIEGGVTPGPEPEPEPGTPTPNPPSGEWDICLSHYRYTPVIVPDPSSPTGYRVADSNFRALHRQFRTIRALNWCGLLNRDVNWSWDNRVTDAHISSWDKTGLPIEALIQVANECEADLWWCGPQQAPVDFARRAADLFAKHLNGTVYVEWGNENWASDRGWFYHGNSGGDWGAGIRNYADDSAAKFAAMRPILGNKLVAVMGGQKDNLGVLSTHILPHMSDSADIDEVDAITCSGYFGNRPDNWRADLDKAKVLMSQHAALAGQYGLDFLIYELNQHIQLATSDMSVVDSGPVIAGVKESRDHAIAIGAKRICMYSGAGRRYPNAPWPMYSTAYKPFATAVALGMPTI